MKRLSRPRVEQLEDRCVPASWGNPWPDPGHLTVSFAPDGTSVGNRASQLFQLLNGTTPTAQWESTFLRALQTWAVNANINIGIVSDNGAAFGTPGLPQGDPRFGDIRVAAYPMAPDVMAVTSPFDPTAGTWAGDVKLNSAYRFGNGGHDHDLFTVALHEVAHSFGLADNQDPTSILFQSYQGAKTNPSGQDIAALQAIYGPRTPDPFEESKGNGTFATATSLNFLQNSDGSLGIKAAGDITTLVDVDLYRVQAPLNVGKMQFVLHTSGLSLLVPKLTVYDANHRVLQTVTSSGPQGDDLSVTVSGLLPLGTYYVKVEGGTQDVFGIGGYELQVKSIPLVNSLTGLLSNTVNTATQLVNSLPLNDSLLTATLLAPLSAQTPSRFNYAYQGSISSNSNVDYYRVQAPQSAATSTVLTVMAWGTGNGGLVPRADVLDTNGKAVAVNVLTNENSVFILQIDNARPGAAYFVKIAAADPKGAHNTGNYFLAVQFGGQAVQLDTIAQGTLDAAHPQQFDRLAISSSQLFHLVLSADTGTTTAGGVRMTLYDASGKIVTSLTAFSGQPPTSITLTLAKGIYTVRITGGGPNGKPLSSIKYILRLSRLSDPIGPQPDDPTNSPSTNGSTTSTTSDNGQNPAPPDDGSQATTTGTGSDPSAEDSGTVATDPAPSGTTGSDPSNSADPSPTGTDPSPTGTDPSPTSTDPSPGGDDPNSTPPASPDPSQPTNAGDSTTPTSTYSPDPSAEGDGWIVSPYDSYYGPGNSVQPDDPYSNPYSTN